MYKVVIIDDDPINNFIYSNIVQEYSEQVEIITFDESELGLNEIVQNYSNIDLVLLDINMPLIDGWFILESLEIKEIEVKIIILTSSISEDDFKKAKNYKNLAGYMLKPSSQEELSFVLSKFLK